MTPQLAHVGGGSFEPLQVAGLTLVATAYALTGSSLNIVTILLYAQIRGDVLHDPNLGYALALGMILITGLSKDRKSVV